MLTKLPVLKSSQFSHQCDIADLLRDEPGQGKGRWKIHLLLQLTFSVILNVHLMSTIMTEPYYRTGCNKFNYSLERSAICICLLILDLPVLSTLGKGSEKKPVKSLVFYQTRGGGHHFMK